MDNKRKKRFFISMLSESSNSFFIGQKEYNHLKNVLRLKEGDIVYGITKDGTEYKGEIATFYEEQVECKIISTPIKEKEKSFNLTIMPSIIKEKKMALIFEKATELGVDNIIPLVSKHSSCFKHTDFNKKIQRWDTIAKNSAKQCGNLNTTQILPALNIQNIGSFDFSHYSDILLLSFQRQTFIHDILKQQNIAEKNFLIIIGPEGGLTKQEEELFVSKGAKPVCLTDKTLRAETAFFYIATLFDFFS